MSETVFRVLRWLAAILLVLNVVTVVWLDSRHSDLCAARGGKWITRLQQCVKVVE